MNVTSLPLMKPWVFGEVVLDCFEDGAKVLGGAPFNVAWHLQNLGLAPLFISAVGKDEMGGEVVEAMKSIDMAADGLQIKDDLPTGHVRVSHSEGEPQYDIVENVAFDFIDENAIAQPDNNVLLYNGTLALRNQVSKASLSALIDNHDITRFVDVNLRDPWWNLEQTIELLRYSDYVKLNEHELNILAGEELHQQFPGEPGMMNAPLAEAFKQEHEIVNLIVTLGDKGASLIDAEGHCIDVPAPPRSSKFVDSVGAGDAFSAVMIFAIIHHWDLSSAMMRAQEFASFIVTQQGATCKEPSIYQDFLSLWGHAR